MSRARLKVKSLVFGVCSVFIVVVVVVFYHPVVLMVIGLGNETEYTLLSL